jgi:AcrR family transcriptional regulator
VRVRPVEHNDLDRNAEIFRTAAAIFRRKGFHATAVGEIAEAVDLTKAGLYHYVSGKEDLLFGIMSFGMDRLEGWLAPARELDDALDRLRAVLEAHARGITEDGSAITVLVDEIEALSPEHRETIRTRQREYFEFIRACLGELVADGRSRIDPTVGAFGLLGMIMWLARWYRRDGPLSPDEVAAQITDLALNGVLTKEKR